MTTAAVLAPKPKRGDGFKVILGLACIVVVVAGLRAASDFLLPAVVGFFLAFLSLPILKWLQDRGLPRWLAVLMTVVFDVFVLSVFVLIGGGIVSSFEEQVPEYVKELDQRIVDLIREVEIRLKAGEDFQEVDLLKSYKSLFDPLQIITLVRETGVIQRAATFLTKSFFALVVMIFVLTEADRYSVKVAEVMRANGPDLRRFQRASLDIQRYLAIKTGVSLVTGLLAWVVCLIFGVKFAFLWGLVAFLFNYVPAIGSVLAAVPPVLLALLQGNMWFAVGVLIGYLIINMTLGNFVEPMLLGERFGISTLVVILSVLFWGFVWGPIGMFLAMPLTMVVKVMLDNTPDLRWLSVMMGKGTVDELEVPLGPPGSASIPVPGKDLPVQEDREEKAVSAAGR